MKVDMHCHVGLLGDRWPDKGGMSQSYRESIVFKLFLLFTRIAADEVCDKTLKERTLEIIMTSGLDKVVCLALDPVFRESGIEARGLSHLWVSNEYLLELRKESNEKILFGASVHPYDDKFEDRVSKYIDEGAVLLKWLPSAQQIDLSHPKVAKALKFLARKRANGKVLPLLLHCGPEYAIPTSDSRAGSYDYLTWSTLDRIVNFLRFGKRWYQPKIKQLHRNLEVALNEGAVIIFAHCGLPYFFRRPLGRYFEHSEFDVVWKYLERTAGREFKGKCLADVSAFATPFRKRHFKKVGELPQDLLLYGSDFPTPVFELSADYGEMMNDLKAMLNGDLRRVVVPQDNLLDVNYREMWHAFPGAKMFTNFVDHGFLDPLTP